MINDLPFFFSSLTKQNLATLSVLLLYVFVCVSALECLICHNRIVLFSFFFSLQNYEKIYFSYFFANHEWIVSDLCTLKQGSGCGFVNFAQKFSIIDVFSCAVPDDQIWKNFFHTERIWKASDRCVYDGVGSIHQI